ncbi:sensor domain-containing protein [Mycobacterium intracellulare]|uniref:sensor domain-containing protein n=1 Tax=Mycobacterium intracellulare TaxID=1767 RepID=UPI0012FE7C3F|nr:sensor domain-containing protein [Mycobacterium intracellulare]
MTRMRLAPNAVRLIPVLVASALITLAAGCADVVGGTVHAAPDLKPRPLVGEVIKQAMLTDAELSHVFGQSFKIDDSMPPKFGGPAEMYWDWPGASHSDCAALAHILMGEPYRNAQVVNVAHEQWWAADVGEFPTVINLVEGVVALPTAAAANALFEKFGSQWSRCTGQRLDSGLGFQSEITEVHAGDSVVEATVEDGDMHTKLRRGRALGVRGNCLVEVEAVYFRNAAPAAGKDASDVARAMMGKISDRS